MDIESIKRERSEIEAIVKRGLTKVERDEIEAIVKGWSVKRESVKVERVKVGATIKGEDILPPPPHRAQRGEWDFPGK